jgi:hypothetical protein
VGRLDPPSSSGQRYRMRECRAAFGARVASAPAPLCPPFRHLCQEFEDAPLLARIFPSVPAMSRAMLARCLMKIKIVRTVNRAAVS